MSTTHVLGGLATAILATTASADVLTVGSAHDFPDLASAIAAAQDGDAIVVYEITSSTSSAAIDGISLSIVGRAAFPVFTGVGALVVENLAAGQTVALSNLNIGGAVAVRNSTGAVRIADCIFTAPYGSDGLYVTNADDVALVNSTVQGGPGRGPSSSEPVEPGEGVFARNSLVGLYGSSVAGGAGWTEVTCYGFDGLFCFCYVPGAWKGGPGADGIETPDAGLFLSGSVVDGGWGGQGGTVEPNDCPIGDPSGPGGNGVQLEGTPLASVSALDTIVSGGPAGFPSGYGVPDGQDVVVVDGTYTTLPGTAAGLLGDAVLTSGDPLALSITGAPGDEAFFYLSMSADRIEHPLFTGPLLVGTPIVRRWRIGTIPANGRLDFTLPFPPLAPGQLARTWFGQSVVTNAQGAQAGAALPLVTLDPSF